MPKRICSKKKTPENKGKNKVKLNLLHCQIKKSGNKERVFIGLVLRNTPNRIKETVPRIFYLLREAFFYNFHR